MSEPLLRLRNVTVDYADESVVRDVSLSVEAAEVVALVGESGSGKTQTLHAVLGLLSNRARVTGSALFKERELIGAPEVTLGRLRGDRITLVFQAPMTALDPLVKVGDQIADVVAAHGGDDPSGRAAASLRDVDIAGGAARAGAFPHQLSGGERQRIMIAMALANRPDLLIADEPTTALDATVQKRILDGLEARRRELGLAMILVTHDLRLARRYAARIYVMRAGRIIEEGATTSIFASPREAYTKSLIEAAPVRRASGSESGSAEVLACRALSVPTAASSQ